MLTLTITEDKNKGMDASEYAEKKELTDRILLYAAACDSNNDGHTFLSLLCCTNSELRKIAGTLNA